MEFRMSPHDLESRPSEIPMPRLMGQPTCGRWIGAAVTQCKARNTATNCNRSCANPEGDRHEILALRESASATKIIPLASAR